MRRLEAHLLLLVALAPCLQCMQQRSRTEFLLDVHLETNSENVDIGHDCAATVNKSDGMKYCIDEEEVRDAQADLVDMERIRKVTGSYRVEECHKTLLPSMVYLGQGHSASTSFAIQLDAHPELSYGLTKEHHWGELLFGGNGYLNEYAAQFKVPCNTTVAMDFSPGEYLDGHRGSNWMQWRRKQLLPWVEKAHNISAIAEPTIMRNVLGPNTKLIVMLRDPVDFLASLPDWWEERVKNVDGDCYAIGVARWLQEFPGANVLFIKMEQYVEKPQVVLSQVFEFLGVSPFTAGTAPQSGRRRHAANITDYVRKKYHSDPRNIDCRKRLEQLTGLEFHWAFTEPTSGIEQNVH
jgi:hypothetical protein